VASAKEIARRTSHLEKMRGMYGQCRALYLPRPSKVMSDLVEPATERSANDDQVAVLTRNATRPSRHGNSHVILTGRSPQDNCQNFVESDIDDFSYCDCEDISHQPPYREFAIPPRSPRFFSTNTNVKMTYFNITISAPWTSSRMFYLLMR